jgi:hypothetical protein
MKKSLKTLVLAALCTSALTGVSQAAPVFTITGVSQNAFTYGPAPGDNNVINSPGAGSLTSSGVSDGAAPTTWIGSSISTNSFVNVTGLAASEKYIVGFTYIGSESDNRVQFTLVSNGSASILVNGAIPTTDDNRNNSCVACQFGSHGPNGQLPMGSVTYQNTGGTNTPAFKLTDLDPPGGTVTNGGANGTPASGAASLIFSYANCVGTACTLTSSQTAFVVFGFNDNGFNDDNHDDFMGLLSVVSGGFDQPTPIPGALPLFGTVLGGGLLFRRLRKRKAA